MLVFWECKPISTLKLSSGLKVFVDSAVCVRTGDEVVQGWRRKFRVKKTWGGIWRRDLWNRSSFETVYWCIEKKKVLTSTEFQSFQHLSTVFDVVLNFNRISIISTIPTGVRGSFPLFICQDIWMIFATPQKRSKVFSRRLTWMAQAQLR